MLFAALRSYRVSVKKNACSVELWNHLEKEGSTNQIDVNQNISSSLLFIKTSSSSINTLQASSVKAQVEWHQGCNPLHKDEEMIETMWRSAHTDKNLACFESISFTLMLQQYSWCSKNVSTERGCTQQVCNLRGTRKAAAAVLWGVVKTH